MPRFYNTRLASAARRSTPKTSKTNGEHSGSKFQISVSEHALVRYRERVYRGATDADVVKSFRSSVFVSPKSKGWYVPLILEQDDGKTAYYFHKAKRVVFAVAAPDGERRQIITCWTIQKPDRPPAPKPHPNTRYTVMRGRNGLRVVSGRMTALHTDGRCTVVVDDDGRELVSQPARRWESKSEAEAIAWYLRYACARYGGGSKLFTFDHLKEAIALYEGGEVQRPEAPVRTAAEIEDDRFSVDEFLGSLQWMSLPKQEAAIVEQITFVAGSLTRLRAQIDAAKGDRLSYGERSDPQCWAKANAAKQLKGQQHQVLQRELGRVRRAIKTAGGKRTMNDHFRDAAREIIPRELYEDIVSVASARYQEQLRALGEAETIASDCTGED